VTITPSTVYITPNPTVTVPSTAQSSSGSTALPNIGAHKQNTNVGAIAGGVVGGVVVLAALAVLAFFLIRKSKKDKAAQQNNNVQTHQQQAAASIATAWNNHNQNPDIGGKPAQQPVYAPAPAGYASPQNEKPMATQEAYRPPLLSNYGSELSTEHAPQQSPPVYAQPSPSTRPPSNFTELDPHVRTPSAGPPVSPIGTIPTASSELGGASRISSPAPQHAELGGQNRGSYQVPPNVQEIGASSGGITRPPAGQQRQSALDMSGAPMSEEYHHELP
jgi:hypothetical protein